MPRTIITRAALVGALALALVGCAPSGPTAQDLREQYEADQMTRELHRIQADTYERDMRRIVREELERQAPKGLRP